MYSEGLNRPRTFSYLRHWVFSLWREPLTCTKAHVHYPRDFSSENENSFARVFTGVSTVRREKRNFILFFFFYKHLLLPLQY